MLVSMMMVAALAQEYRPATGLNPPIGDFARFCASAGGAPGAALVMQNTSEPILVYDGGPTQLSVWVRGASAFDRLEFRLPPPATPQAREYILREAGALSVKAHGPVHIRFIGSANQRWVEYCIKADPAL